MKVIKSQEKAIINNPYQNTVATVRIGNQLHPEELAYRAYREPKVKAALESLLGRSLDGKKIPVIAFIGSGGGYRAMLGSTGFMVGAEKIGLVGCRNVYYCVIRFNMDVGNVDDDRMVMC